MTTNYVPLRGSERSAPAGARRLDAVGPGESLEISVYLRPRTPLAESMRSGRRLTRSAYASLHGADPVDVDRLAAYAGSCGLRVERVELERRLVVLSGSAATHAKAFGTELHYYQRETKTFRGRIGAIQIPADLETAIVGIFGLDNRPQVRPQHRLLRANDAPLVVSSFTPPEVASLYSFPRYGTGSGQCIGILELGGGFREDDLQTYFSGLGLPVPQITAVSIDGQNNSPGDDSDNDSVEVMLDIEVAGSVANGASIAVYFAPNSDQGFIDAFSGAVFDQVNHPSVISVSWGEDESDWSGQALGAMEQVLQSASMLGVTISVSAGDSGSEDGQDGGNAHVAFPGSSPFVLCCGGTHMESGGGTISFESVWNNSHGATGGGISDVFDLPDYQVNTGVPPSANAGHRVGRGIPDIAGDSDPVTGYQIRANGANIVVGGTSAAAPLWAALIALINEQIVEPLGFVNPALYQDLIFQANITNDITIGGIDAYSAGPGWDACTGLGTPNGENLMAAIIY
jgi:kumamolisin